MCLVGSFLRYFRPSLRCQWLKYSEVITDTNILETIANKKIKISLKVNNTPTVLATAPILVNDVVPTVLIVYCLPTTKEPADTL